MPSCTLYGVILHVVEIMNLPTIGNIPRSGGHQGKRFHPSGRKAIQKSNNYIHFIMKLVEINQIITVLQKKFVLKLKNNLEETKWLNVNRKTRMLILIQRNLLCCCRTNFTALILNKGQILFS